MWRCDKCYSNKSKQVVKDYHSTRISYITKKPLIVKDISLIQCVDCGHLHLSAEEEKKIDDQIEKEAWDGKEPQY